ncbi:F-box/kelch-repeat protein At3g23880-like [Lycium barbarum]|uniref:F-box/kelch-repeat protein At3g23880-like n=1 Tax=Lycium barbarum TaxID=112863 RepID=UPI00293E8B7E|nr:F-box/kelch-repeat protein At3g23880-like [Lycium barbarum]XP_060181743.1 F-box/kelch-repeat protein At3g23880-like [Lycium barbarum]XP_060181744.1 F-box/kelch-repeat protein At3g23880-like [Lycium barbarum]XP_060181745.1 F-box/kelch-repeat protein At3g23880-like [Lycium barbarum]XP_060181746.1 F-box/kelch-repeat protein At3g23880-like [Lycium barbarum]XP_060181747.1 F-box/kelch-repeat protein At3g23880-like [Lycium barbarum]
MKSEDTHQHPKRSKPTNHSQNPSTSMQDSILEIPILPPELITEILSRLPVKSLLRFRCVSKSWLSLICSNEFINIHLSLSSNNKEYTHHRLMLSFVQPEYNLKDCSLGSLLNGGDTEAFDLDYPMKNPHKSVWIVGSVNGLICVAIEENDLFLWNPSIRKFKKLPDSRPKLRCGYYFMYGFGYDEVRDDYKVVGIFCIFGSGGAYEVEVKIYGLKSDSWRNVDDFQGGLLLNDSGKFVNGKLHWATTARLGEYNCWDIISVDLTDEKWGKVEQPCYEEGNFDFVMGVLENDLSVLCNYQKTRADVWVMKEYGVKDSWTKMYTIRCPNDPGKYMFSPPLCVSNKGEILLVFGSIFMIYNPDDDSIRYPEVTNFDACLEAEIYIETLVSPLLRNEPSIQQQ